MKMRTSEDLSLLLLLGCIAIVIIINTIEIAIMKTEITDMKYDLYDLTYRMDSTTTANDTIEYFSTKTQHYETME